MNWKQSSISEVQTAVRDGKPTATELAKLCFAEIESRNTVIHAYLAVSRERALASSEAVDQLAAQGKPLPPLAGVPIGIKDVLVMKGFSGNCRISHTRGVSAALRRHRCEASGSCRRGAGGKA